MYLPKRDAFLMNEQKNKRRRGVILTIQGFEKLQAAKLETESNENSDKRYTLEALSYRTGLDPDTLMKVFSCQTRVDKQTLQRCFRAFNLQIEPSDYQLPQEIQHLKSHIQNGIDWGEAPDVSVFYGRTQELTTLSQWIIQERCRVVTLLGMGGIGKTWLSVKLAEQIQNKFDFVIWRSLRYAPPVQDMLAEIIKYISNYQLPDLPVTISGQISLLMNYLKSARCLLILDNVETILQAASCNYSCGSYHQGYEGYGELIRRIGETQHQSCLVLTSREKPQEIGLLQGETLPVRVWQLTGLQIAEAKEIFQAKGYFSASPEEWRRLIDFYAGNPLKLNIVATTIQKLFDGNVSEFLKHQTRVFGSILLLLKQQIERLSDTEKILLTWLAVNPQTSSVLELQEQISLFISPQKLLETLQSLQERSLIEKNTVFFSLQPLVIEYVTDQLRQEKIAYHIKHDQLSEIEFRQLNQISQTKTHF